MDKHILVLQRIGYALSLERKYMIGYSKIVVELAGEQSKTYLKHHQLNFHLDLNVTSYRFLRSGFLVSSIGKEVRSVIPLREWKLTATLRSWWSVKYDDQTYICDLIFCTLFLFRTRQEWPGNFRHVIKRSSLPIEPLVYHLPSTYTHERECLRLRCNATTPQISQLIWRMYHV